MDIIHTIGRRKTSVARLYVNKGKGKITVNNKKHTEYFTTPSLQYKIMQAEAIRLAISRALCKINSEHRAELKPEGLLTRDPRMVERKKFGQKKARKKFQFSKR